MTERESEWSDDDQAWMVALAAWRAIRCPSCGRDVAECTNPESEDRWHVPDPGRCYATTAVAIKAKGYEESPQPHALLYRAERR